ncbi:MAG: COX15/CtaA family protein [Caulobacteraceae bacterium]
MTSFLRSGRSRPVAIWLFAVALMVLAMVVVGGATRLTESGLSITEWKPISGVLPPLSEADWQAEFAHYKLIPQYAALNQGMTLEAFKGIYWWEWAHRLLGRLVGFVFAAPFVWFLIRRELPARLIWRCAVLFALGGLQGLVGWWMVASGLADRISVAPERLAAHLGLALTLFCALIWTGLEAWAGQARAKAGGPWRISTLIFLTAVLFQSLLGALVAGNDAGRIYNDWPLMNGEFFPGAYASGGLWATLAHSQAAVQFNHRIGAYLILFVAVCLAVYAARRNTEGKVLVFAVLGLVILQAGLGVSTLMLAAPLGLSLAHQTGAALVLAAATALAWRAGRAER